jgi:hypothetical protein
MYTKIITALIGLALLITGCEIPKDEMSKKPYIVIINKISDTGCSTLDITLETASYGTTSGAISIDHLYTEQNVTCATYNKDEDHCKEATLFDINILDDEEDTNASGDGTCVLGAGINILNILF